MRIFLPILINFFDSIFFRLLAIGDPGEGKKPETLAKFGSNSSNKFIVFTMSNGSPATLVSSRPLF